jgi:hypothetical protein
MPQLSDRGSTADNFVCFSGYATEPTTLTVTGTARKQCGASRQATKWRDGTVQVPSVAQVKFIIIWRRQLERNGSIDAEPDLRSVVRQQQRQQRVS